MYIKYKTGTILNQKHMLCDDGSFRVDIDMGIITAIPVQYSIDGITYLEGTLKQFGDGSVYLYEN